MQVMSISLSFLKISGGCLANPGDDLGIYKRYLRNILKIYGGHLGRYWEYLKEIGGISTRGYLRYLGDIWGDILGIY